MTLLRLTQTPTAGPCDRSFPLAPAGFRFIVDASPTTTRLSPAHRRNASGLPPARQLRNRSLDHDAVDPFERPPPSCAQQQHTTTSQPAGRPVIAPEALEGRTLMAAPSAATGCSASLPTPRPATTRPRPTSRPSLARSAVSSRRTIASATRAKKSLDFTVSSDISEPRDVGLYKFTVSKNNHTRSVRHRHHPRPPLDSALRLFDKAGNELAFNDDGTAAFEPVVKVDSAIDYTFSKAGTYYIGVSGSGNDQYNTITGFGDRNASTKGKYKLIVTQLPPPDPNDTIENAEATETEAFITGKLDWAGDVDMYKFDVLGGTTLSFDIEQDAIIGPADTILRLFDADGNELAINDDGGTPTRTRPRTCSASRTSSSPSTTTARITSPSSSASGPRAASSTRGTTTTIPTPVRTSTPARSAATDCGSRTRRTTSDRRSQDFARQPPQSARLSSRRRVLRRQRGDPHPCNERSGGGNLPPPGCVF